MFGLFEKRQREAAQNALDEQREMERAARSELAELKLAATFSADEIVIIRRYQNAKSAFDRHALRNVAGMTVTERAVASIEYQQAADDYRRASLAYHAVIQGRQIESPLN